MGVKIKKRGSKWYVYVNWYGKRKNRCVGTREAAEEVRRKLEAHLALGDTGFLTDPKKSVPSFEAFAHGWLKTYAGLECKPATYRSYEQLLRVHVTPRFGSKLLTEIRRDEVKSFLAELSQATREVNDIAVPKFKRIHFG